MRKTNYIFFVLSAICLLSVSCIPVVKDNAVEVRKSDNTQDYQAILTDTMWIVRQESSNKRDLYRANNSIRPTTQSNEKNALEVEFGHL